MTKLFISALEPVFRIPTNRPAGAFFGPRASAAAIGVAPKYLCKQLPAFFLTGRSERECSSVEVGDGKAIAIDTRTAGGRGPDKPGSCSQLGARVCRQRLLLAYSELR